MKILVIGGMHGNEPLGIKVVKAFCDNPVENVETILANEEAIDRNCRFVEQDLNRLFPGDENSEDYETKRAAELLKLAQGYDVVLDFHNTYCPDNDCGFVGEKAKPELYQVAKFLGLEHVVVADYDCINKYALNCLSIETSLSSKLNNSSAWYDQITTLSKIDQLPAATGINRYRFVYRMTLDDKERLQLDKKELRAFHKMKTEITNELGVKNPAYPIFINDAYTPYNFGGVLNKYQ